MSGLKTEFDFAARMVANAVRERRLELGMSYAELSRALTRVGRDIPTLGLRRIETVERRVDVDDLLALAMVLGVSPITLLMPVGSSRDSMVRLPGGTDVSAEGLWNWLTAAYPLNGSVIAFYGDALPQWERDEIESRLGVVR